MSNDLDLIKDFLKKAGSTPDSASETFFRTEREVDEFKVKYTKENVKFFVKKEGLRFHVIYINLKVLTEEVKQYIEKFSESISIKTNLKESKSFDPS